MWSATLIREARLRAGLTQQELADRSGRQRSVIARWEQGAIEPSLETFLEIIAICGFELPTELVPRDESASERLRKNALLSPERRVQRALRASSPDASFDPYAILASLERRRTAYVVIGSFARIVQGADETTDSVDIAPSLRSPNLDRLALALSDLGVSGPDGEDIVLEGMRHRPAARGVQHLQGRPQSRARARRNTRGVRRPPTRDDARADRKGPSHPGRVDRRPRTHDRRPRTRIGRPEAPRPPPPASTQALASTSSNPELQRSPVHAIRSRYSPRKQAGHRCTFTSAALAPRRVARQLVALDDPVSDQPCCGWISATVTATGCERARLRPVTRLRRSRPSSSRYRPAAIRTRCGAVRAAAAARARSRASA